MNAISSTVILWFFSLIPFPLSLCRFYINTANNRPAIKQPEPKCPRAETAAPKSHDRFIVCHHKAYSVVVKPIWLWSISKEWSSLWAAFLANGLPFQFVCSLFTMAMTGLGALLSSKLVYWRGAICVCRMNEWYAKYSNSQGFCVKE